MTRKVSPVRSSRAVEIRAPCRLRVTVRALSLKFPPLPSTPSMRSGTVSKSLSDRRLSEAMSYPGQNCLHYRLVYAHAIVLAMYFIVQEGYKPEWIFIGSMVAREGSRRLPAFQL